jgi:glycosyltransferase involved in cell wall biosynthesis
VLFEISEIRDLKTILNQSPPATLLPISVVIPTRDRASVLRLTLESIASQSMQPAQIVLVDASDDQACYEACVESAVDGLIAALVWMKAETAGAASQRNQGVLACEQPTIGFFDDDILLMPDCMQRLWQALQGDVALGGVGATITNQTYQHPGLIGRLVFRLMAVLTEVSYAGLVVGPAVNFLPDDREDLPEIVPVQWLNLGCVLYRKDALPNPPFPGHFVGYSMMEDLTLSWTVGQNWKLANARTARIFHDSQPGLHKSDASALAEMELVNRHYVMTRVLLRRSWVDMYRLIIWELFQLAVSIKTATSLRPIWHIFVGKTRGLQRLVLGKGGASG